MVGNWACELLIGSVFGTYLVLIIHKRIIVVNLQYNIQKILLRFLSQVNQISPVRLYLFFIQFE